MAFLICWVVFPVVLLVLAFGCGLLLEWLAGLELPPALVAPAGYAVIVVVGTFATVTSATAALATPAVAGVAAAGYAAAVVRVPRRSLPLDAWSIVAAVGVFAAFSAPVVLSGEATFAGYIKLDDTATYLAMTDRVMEHGRNLAGLAPSSYEATLSTTLAYGYPVGSLVPLGVGRVIVDEDAAWLWQPYLSFLAVQLTLALYAIVSHLIPTRPLRVLAVFVASQSALLFGYALWGGIKELAAAALIALASALVPITVEDGRWRAVLPLAAATAATFGVLSLGGATWVAPILVAALPVAIFGRGRTVGVVTAAFVAVTIVLSIPSLVAAGNWLPRATSFTSGAEFGNLLRPLSWRQLFGIWPTGDFRGPPKNEVATDVLIAVVAAAAGVGIAWAWQRRTWALLLYVGGSVAGCVLLMSAGSPWVDAKALATASPALLVAAAAGCARLFYRGRRVEAAVAAAAISCGVLWSNALAYHDVNLAPRSQLAELERIGRVFSGQGPALMTEYQPYGVRHFLRALDPEGASELRRRTVPLTNGDLLPKGGSANLDAFQLAAVLTYRLLVLRRSPVESRPPSPYQRVWSGRYYEVWRRPEAPVREIVEHLPLGRGAAPAAVARCAAVMRLADRGGHDVVLAAPPRSAPVVVDLSRIASPEWIGDSATPGAVYPLRPGSATGAVTIAKPGPYDIWVRGSFRRRLQIVIDGAAAAVGRGDLNHAGQYAPLGQVRLDAGRHSVTLVYGDAKLDPGSGGTVASLGPLVLSRHDGDSPVLYLRPENARAFCGKRLDWIEALAQR
jgi:hypothetical protein